MTIKSVICDIDGVLMHDNTAVPGAQEFLQRILAKEMPLVVLTNYPSQTEQIWLTALPQPVSRCRLRFLYLRNGNRRLPAPSGGQKGVCDW